MEFYLQVLYFKNLGPKQKQTLIDNECTYVPDLGVWLFEGDWERAFTGRSRGLIHIGEIILGFIADYKPGQLVNEIKGQLSKDDVELIKHLLQTKESHRKDCYTRDNKN